MNKVLKRTIILVVATFISDRLTRSKNKSPICIFYNFG